MTEQEMRALGSAASLAGKPLPRYLKNLEESLQRRRLPGLKLTLVPTRDGELDDVINMHDLDNLYGFNLLMISYRGAQIFALCERIGRYNEQLDIRSVSSGTCYCSIDHETSEITSYRVQSLRDELLDAVGIKHQTIELDLSFRSRTPDDIERELRRLHEASVELLRDRRNNEMTQEEFLEALKVNHRMTP